MSLQLHVLPKLHSRPSASHFCQKLETWLRAAGYTDYAESPDTSSGPKGKWPWVTLPSGEDMGDSYFIIRHLISTGTIRDIDKALTPATRADARAWVVQVDELMCPVTWCEIFLIKENYAELKVQMLSGMPRLAQALAGWWLRRSTKTDLWAQGVGRHSQAEWKMILAEFLDNVVQKLGQATYLFGAEPCSADVAVYALLVNCLEIQGISFVRKRILADKRMKQYVEGLTERWFPEYDEVRKLVKA
ncbi:hypothetical protein CALVIDRAFT_569335 [Calocera viscosa TUFC12733]|uniref:Thioredoxin-like fold domain-containing protein n=1 Tax=Calocera viscosa (strain TUFC12733) TaxID=1330018 RepID=A0A167G3F0_CALVF|nr:hypothetical protein CALVIDRAFT_569335 [Calocera viscosa TUFC12733]